MSPIRNAWGRVPLLAAAFAVAFTASPAHAKPQKRRHPAPRRTEQYGPPVPIALLPPYEQCDAAITAAERGLPDKLLPAISRVESGRLDSATGRVRPWPWTINVEGVGSFFDSKEQAVAAVSALQARGVRSIDVGCMQVNLMHHAKAFASLDEAFDPAANAVYAAKFLTSLHGMLKDWNLATAAYHSMDPERGEDYQRRVFGRVMAPMGAGGGTATVVAAKSSGPYGVWPPTGSNFAALPPVNFAFGAFSTGSPVLVSPLPGGLRRR